MRRHFEEHGLHGVQDVDDGGSAVAAHVHDHLDLFDDIIAFPTAYLLTDYRNDELDALGILKDLLVNKTVEDVADVAAIIKKSRHVDIEVILVIDVLEHVWNEGLGDHCMSYLEVGRPSTKHLIIRHLKLHQLFLREINHFLNHILHRRLPFLV